MITAVNKLNVIYPGQETMHAWHAYVMASPVLTKAMLYNAFVKCVFIKIVTT